MTPPEPQPPATIGTQPRNADEVNALIGSHLREFVTSKNRVNQDHAWLVTVDLKLPPYNFTQEQEATLKSGIGDLDASLDDVDMTTISRIIGM